MNWGERVLAAGLLLACPQDTQREDWARIEPGLALSYPRDHGAHPRFRTEWWYLTGQASDADGRRFGFQVTVFRNGLGRSGPAPAPPSGEEAAVGSDPGAARVGSSPQRARELYFGHFAIADIERGSTRFAERMRRGGTPLASASRDDLELALEDWSLLRVPADTAGGDPEHLLVRAADPATAIGLDLRLEPLKPLVLHGVNGYSAKGDEPGNASAYASWTRLAARGVLVVDGREHRVDGRAWFDHEHGSSVLGAGVVGWDWFGLALDDGRELMLFGLRRADGSFTPSSAGTLVAADGTPQPLARADFTLEPRAQWTSPHTGAVYPAGWSIAVPGAELALVVEPLVADAELRSEDSTGVTYWEGPVAVSGTTTGSGYAELTGYAGAMTGRF